MAKIKESKPDKTPELKTVDIQNDEHRGIGGSYVFDPDTGKRTRIAGPKLDETATAEMQAEKPSETEAVRDES